MAVTFRYVPPKVNALPVVRAAAEVAVAAGAEHLLEASQPGVPVEEGVLKASGRVSRDGLTATVSYGRDDDGTGDHAPSSQYAVKQHEDLSLAHPHGGSAKWLETAMHSEQQRLAVLIAEHIRKAAL